MAVFNSRSTASTSSTRFRFLHIGISAANLAISRKAATNSRVMAKASSGGSTASSMRARTASILSSTSTSKVSRRPMVTRVSITRHSKASKVLRRFRRSWTKLPNPGASPACGRTISWLKDTRKSTTQCWGKEAQATWRPMWQSDKRVLFKTSKGSGPKGRPEASHAKLDRTVGRRSGPRARPEPLACNRRSFSAGAHVWNRSMVTSTSGVPSKRPRHGTPP
mmetsp:Transcript_124131/g.358960  ORF Transcript_124131/g.358960 Transcript_124131/m.358960 type:complete len:222 (+) Transcript_124131:277-942(+)